MAKRYKQINDCPEMELLKNMVGLHGVYGGAKQTGISAAAISQIVVGSYQAAAISVMNRVNEVFNAG